MKIHSVPSVDKRHVPNTFLFTLPRASSDFKTYPDWEIYLINSLVSWKIFSSLISMVCSAFGSETYRIGS